MKNLGIITVILGALALIVPSLAGFESNTTLATGGILLIVGAISHVIFIKKSMEKEDKTK